MADGGVDGAGEDLRERLAVALDVQGLDRAERLATALGGVPGWLKVGSELFVGGGPAAVTLAARHARVFLDLKFHDIPNQVAGAVGAAAALGASMLTVHLSGGAAMLRAARDAAAEAATRNGGERPWIVGVSVLTSLGDADLARIGVPGPAADQVARLVDLALECGLDGVVASPQEAAAVRRRAGPAFRIVTPGVRPVGSAGDDQARTATPAEALAAGADLLVVGRPVTRAANPAAAARAILAELAGGRAAASR